MNITTNSIGNYSINRQVSRVNQKPAVKDEVSLEANVNKKEKDFFSGLYPKNKTEIAGYHFYSRTGELSGVSLGQNIDRKM